MTPEKDQPVAVCLRCLNPLTTQQIAVSIRGELLEWNTRVTVPTVTFTLCDECHRTIYEVMKQGIRGAVKRREEIERLY